ncbi:MAG: class I SAM-dependent methyltransferase [Desulfobulbaceae bacterium]|nr:class I SAM-dependent methyltransferase [Desulfobulbaceae bacterium]
MNKSVSKYYNGSDRELAQRYIRDIADIGTKEYYEAALAHRYGLYPEIPRIAAFESFKDKDVLEIGVGQGADHFMFAKGGASLSGIDLTEKHCRMTRQFLDAFGLHSNVLNGSACNLPFPSASFDHVYSCGVLLLVQDIEKALSEIYRVLRPGGTVTLMLYNKRSLHYLVKTRLYYGWMLGEDKAIGRQAVNDWYTDGPGYVRVYHYAPRDLKWIYKGFCDIAYQTSCLTPEQMPEVGLPLDNKASRWLERRFGFFLWGTARKP